MLHITSDLRNAIKIYLDTITQQKFKRLTIPTVNKDITEQKLSYTAGRNVKWHNIFWKTG